MDRVTPTVVADEIRAVEVAQGGRVTGTGVRGTRAVTASGRGERVGQVGRVVEERVGGGDESLPIYKE